MLAGSAFSSGAGFANTGAADTYGGKLKFSRITGNTYVFEGSLGCAGYLTTTSGSVALSDVLTRIRVTTANGTDNYDAGTLALAMEG